jgi:nucleoside triphosphate pyrophosphatase
MKIYLASKSPRRQSLLRQINVDYECVPVDIDETSLNNELARNYVERIAGEKARAGWASAARQNDWPVLSADTSVILENNILGKPIDHSDAANMLRRLSGKTHQVITSVAVKLNQQVDISTSITEVTFAPLGDDLIDYYVSTNDCMDKAGSYGIQGYAARFVTSICGSYTGVVGLPLFETAELLKLVCTKNKITDRENSI